MPSCPTSPPRGRDVWLSLKPAALALALLLTAAAAAQRLLSPAQTRAALTSLGEKYDVVLVCSEEDIERAVVLPEALAPAGGLLEALTQLNAASTLNISFLRSGGYYLVHDPGAVALVTSLGRTGANRALVAGTDAEAKSTDVLLIRDQPLYRAFDKIGEVYGVTVVYHPLDIPRFEATVRQAPSAVEALRQVVAPTGLAYVAYARDAFVVAPSGRLRRAYADTVVAAWRAGRMRSPDERVADVVRLRVGDAGPVAGSAGDSPAVAVALVSGLVLDAATGEPMIGASVLYPEGRGGTTTEVDGTFALELPTGRRLIEVQSVGYVPQPIQLDVAGDGVLPTVELEEGAAALAEVVVTARDEAEVRRESAGGLCRLDVRELSLLPALSGDLDVLQAVTRTAGVTATAEGSAAVSVRGGSLDANLVRQGGIPVLYPAHALGLYPVFHSALVGDVELYRGYVPPELGGRAASVIDVGWRRGDFEDWHLSGSTGPLSTKIGAEGPLWKDHLSLNLGARASHLNWLLREIQRNGDIRRSVVDFADGSAALSGRWATGRVDLRGFWTEDGFRYGQRFGFDYRNRGARLEVGQRLGPTVSATFAATVSDFRGRQNRIDAPEGASVFGAGLENRQLEASVAWVVEDVRVSAGAIAEAYLTSGRERVPTGESAAAAFSFDDPDLLTVSAYASADYDLSDEWSVSGGLRVTGFESVRPVGPRTAYEGIPSPGTVVSREEATAETRTRLPTRLLPRVRLAYAREGGHVSFGLSYTRLAQPVFQLSPTVSPTPADIFFAASEFLPVTTSAAIALAVASDDAPDELRRVGYEFGVYYRRVRDAHDALGGGFLRATDAPEIDFFTGDGFAAEAEATLRYASPRSRVEVSYAYGRSFLEVDRRYAALRTQDGRYFRAPTDLPHQVNVTYSYRPSGRFTVGAGWTLTSGRPFTGVETLLPQAGRVVPTYATVNGQRLAPTHRLDVSATLDNSRTRRRGLRVGYGLSVYNLYQRDNPYAVFYDNADGRVRAFQFALIGTAVPALTIDFQWD